MSCYKCGNAFHEAAWCPTNSSSNDNNRNTWYTPRPISKPSSYNNPSSGGGGGGGGEGLFVIIGAAGAAMAAAAVGVVYVAAKTAEFTFKRFRKKQNLKQGLDANDPTNNKYATIATATFFSIIAAVGFSINESQKVLAEKYPAISIFYNKEGNVFWSRNPDPLIARESALNACNNSMWFAGCHSIVRSQPKEPICIHYAAVPIWIGLNRNKNDVIYP